MPRARSQIPLLPPEFVRASQFRELSPEHAAPLKLLFSLRACMHRINADLNQWLGADALSPGRMQMLMVLWASPAPLKQRDLVEALNVSRPSVSELVETLEREGLVVTTPDTKDRRAMRVALTPTGRRTAERQLHENAARLSETFNGLTTDEQNALGALIDRLCP